ncbi:TAR DNA-binding protein 43-like [Argopecten irradians]|uniref:TAR DNA-binding protein 43-like n=1 Tax=Argopecten irradians TaxID=31199 RepID=UPI0037159FE6
MSQYIQVTEDEGDDPMEVPSEDDGTLLLSTLAAQFPGACGLKYRNPDSGAFRGIRLSDGRLYPPDGKWGNRMFIAVFPKTGNESKKVREENPVIDNTMIRRKHEKSKCSDLIVLGLPWKSTEEDLRKYFSTIGDLLMVQVKKDTKTGQSKGFGFIRFADYESQLKCMSSRHLIEGRWCDVRIPNSKEGAQNVMNRKVFVGRCTDDMTAEDLRQYFGKYGEVVDVFIPKPFRAFAFVTFADSDVSQGLCGEDHIIKGASVHISSAAPKNYDRQNDKKAMAPGHPGYGQGYAHHSSWSQGGRSNTQAMANQGSAMGHGNMPNNLSLGPIQISPAMLAAAQAMLSGQGGWGPIGLVSQGNNTGTGIGTGVGVNVGGASTPNAQPTVETSSQASAQSFGSIGSNSQATAVAAPVPTGSNSFLGWGSSHSQGSEPGSSPGVGGWGTPQSGKTGATWN